MRSAYWWSLAAVGALGPFLSLYYRRLGLSGAEIGVLGALPPLAVALLAPFWGALADARSVHRAILRAAFVLPALAALAVAIVGDRATFWVLLGLVGLMAVGSSPTFGLTDAFGLAISERTGSSYGSIRVWGSLGYTAGVFITGRLMGLEVGRAFLVAYAACLLLALVSTLGLPSVTTRHARPLFAGLGTVARNRPMLVLLLVTYLISCASSVMYAYLGIHLEEMGGSAGLVGDAFAMNAASELPVLLFGGWIVARLGSGRLLALAMVVYVVRFLAYTVLPTPEWVLAVQALHGLSYGAFLLGSVTLAHRLAGEELAATAQGLLASMSFGFGSITGSLAGGAVLDRLGTVGIFRGAAAVMLVALAVYAVGWRLVGGANDNR